MGGGGRKILAEPRVPLELAKSWKIFVMLRDLAQAGQSSTMNSLLGKMDSAMNLLTEFVS